MENFQFSFNNINQTAANTAVDGDAASTQIAAISDPDTLVSSEGGYYPADYDSWDPDWYYGSPNINVQVSTNVVNQTAVNTAFDGDATSTQAAAISDPDTLGSSGGGDDYHGSPDFNFQISTNVINQTAVNTALGGDATSAQLASIGDGDNLFALG